MPRFVDSARPFHPLRLIAGAVISLAIALLIGALFQAIASAGASFASSRPFDDLPRLLWVGTLQAALSTAFSLLFGTAIAWALNRLRFAGRDFAIALVSAAIVTPGIVVAFGLIAVWGRSGWLGSFGLPIFGLQGVVMAHIILDAPFAARLLLGRLDAIPLERLRTGQSLRLSPWQRFALIDWPAIRGSLVGLGAIIFLLAFTSFPVVLLLGGGPAVQTLEVAIYAAVRLDFDLQRAVVLGLIQVALCGGLILATTLTSPANLTLGVVRASPWRDTTWARGMQVAILVVAALFLASPLLAILSDGVAGLGAVAGQPAFWAALATSLAIAAASAALALTLALAIAAARATTSSTALRTALYAPGYVYLAMPAVTLALGAFILVRNAGLSAEALAPLVVIVANALLALPFGLATLSPPLDTLAQGRGRLIRSLRLGSARQFTAVEWPLIAPDIGLATALAFCFSLGDLGVISLFGTEHVVTLPLLMLRALGAYRSNDAAAIAAVMLVLTTASFLLIPRLTTRLAHA